MYPLHSVKDFNPGSVATYDPRPGTIDVPPYPTTLRLTGSTSALAQPNSTLFCVDGHSGEISQAKCKEAKIDILLDAPVDSTMFVVWPGKHSTDGFQIDNRAKALETLGCKPLDRATDPIRRAADGVHWVVG